MQYAEDNLETLREQLDVLVFVAGESFLFCGRSSNTIALTVQQSPPRCQRIGQSGAPCGYTHGWGRLGNGPLGSLGSIRFSRSLLLKWVSDRHFQICRLYRTSFVHFLFSIPWLHKSLAVGIWTHMLLWYVSNKGLPQNPVPANNYPTDSLIKVMEALTVYYLTARSALCTMSLHYGTALSQCTLCTVWLHSVPSLGTISVRSL